VDFWISLLSYINLAGAIHALIQALVLFFVRRGNRRANRLMALFLLALAAIMANGIITQLGLYDRLPGLSIPMGAMVLAFGPLFFLYIRAITDKSRSWSPLDFLHSLPFLLGLAAYGGFLRWATGGPAPSGVFAAAIRAPWRMVLILSTIQTIAYVAAIIRLLKAHSAKVKATFSTIDRVHLGWLRRRLAVYAAIWGVGCIMIAVVGFGARAVALIAQILAFLTALNTFVTGYRAMLQPEILFGPVESEPRRRYERSSLTPESAAAHRDRLLEMMVRDRPYLDPELTLPKLAQALGIPAAHLSQLLNDGLDRNFYEFVNGYRVEEARRHLADPKAAGDKLIAVALESGFNSLATFNRVFKSIAGCTPSEYRNNPSVT
jgi:AraC-like DNA-binding protein